jgi:hypothetical protein
MPSPRRRVLALYAVLFAALGVVVARQVAQRWLVPEPDEAPPPMVDAPRASRTWKDMARKVEEPRGEPVGRAARVTVPAELQHYRDRKRFLAIQVAATRAQELETPHDYAELARMIARDQLVEVAPMGENYLLYGVAGIANGDPFTHHDPKSGAEITLYDGWGDFRDAYDEMTARLDVLRSEVAAQRQQLRKMPRSTRVQRRRRAALQSRIRGGDGAVRLLDQRRKVMASFYESYDRRRQMVAEYQELVSFAADFEGRSYDLQDPRQRLRLKARLLSFLHPEARDQMLEMARGYRAEFDRPLPVSSLVRTIGYQRTLTRTNRNATQIDTPPHASGLAFDVYIGRMAAAEQQALMETIARLEREGRVEALKERNDHIHVYVLPDGRPSEALIALSKKEVEAAPRPRLAPPAARRPAATRPAARRPAPARPARPAPRPGPQKSL